MAADIHFSPTEALNLGWELAGQGVSDAVKAQVRRYSFRQAVRKEIETAGIVELGRNRSHRRLLRQLIREEELVLWACDPESADMSSKLARLWSDAFRDLDEVATREVAERLLWAYTKVAVLQSEPAMGLVVARVDRIDRNLTELLRRSQQGTSAASERGLDETAGEVARIFVRSFELLSTVQAPAPDVPEEPLPPPPAMSRASPNAEIIRHIAATLVRAGQPDLVPDTWPLEVVVDLRARLDRLLAEPSTPGIRHLIEARGDLDVLAIAMEARDFAERTLDAAHLDTAAHRRARAALLAPAHRGHLPAGDLDRFASVLRSRPADTPAWDQAVSYVAWLAKFADQSDADTDRALRDWAREHDVDRSVVSHVIESAAGSLDARLVVDFWEERQPSNELPGRARATLWISDEPQERSTWELRGEGDDAALDVLGKAVSWAQEKEYRCKHVDVLVPDALLGLRAERARFQVEGRSLSAPVTTTADVFLHYAGRVASRQHLEVAGEKCHRIHKNPRPVQWLDEADLSDPQALYQRLIDPGHSSAVALRASPFPDHVDGLISAVLTTPYVLWPEGTWTRSQLTRRLNGTWKTLPAQLVAQFRTQAEQQLRFIWDDEEWLFSLADRARGPLTHPDEL